ncbi:MAG: hypothetical protein NVV73_15770 [Cellvibrionaceae bacterium]|nr:hypothetical protein [Cellvibrionaceae bacterium]
MVQSAPDTKNPANAVSLRPKINIDRGSLEKNEFPHKAEWAFIPNLLSAVEVDRAIVDLVVRIGVVSNFDEHASIIPA